MSNNPRASRGCLFIVSAPAGTGKTTLVEKLIAEFPKIVRSISYTTRKIRAGEKEGVDYHYLTTSDFEEQIRQKQFLEYVELYGQYYGTHKQWVEDQLAKGKHVILVIDTQGGLQLKGKLPAVFIFIRPPTLEILRERLQRRQTETLQEVEKRLACAERELKQGLEYDYQIINDDLSTAYEVLKSIIIAEEHRIRAE